VAGEGKPDGALMEIMARTIKGLPGQRLSYPENNYVFWMMDFEL
jgi:hypothetical protein